MEPVDRLFWGVCLTRQLQSLPLLLLKGAVLPEKHLKDILLFLVDVSYPLLYPQQLRDEDQREGGEIEFLLRVVPVGDEVYPVPRFYLIVLDKEAIVNKNEGDLPGLYQPLLQSECTHHPKGLYLVLGLSSIEEVNFVPEIRVVIGDREGDAQTPLR